MPQADKEQREAWKQAPLPDLVRHLVGTCHLECREDMARLETLVELVAMEEGYRRQDLLAIRDKVAQFANAMRAHLAMEERSLFPFILGLQDGRIPASRQESLEVLRAHLEKDHEAEAGLLRGSRVLTSTMAEEEEPSSSRSQIHAAMKVLSERLQMHLYLENQVLFPRTR